MMEKIGDPSELKLCDVMAWNQDTPQLGAVQWLVQIEKHPKIRGDFIVLDLDALDDWPNLEPQLLKVRK